MEKEIVAHFTAILTKRLQEILPGIQVLKDALKEGSEMRPLDEVDLSSSRYSLEIMMRIQSRSHQELQEIASALRRLNRGDFGTCTLCDNAITLERLKAQPTTMVCIDCKRDLEGAERIKVA